MFKNVDYEILQFVKDYEFNGIEYDSRKIKEGNIFVAMKGFSLDGNKYIKNAIENGAKTVITDSKEIEFKEFKNINFYYVKDLRMHLGVIASNLYNYPQDKIKILAVTGTNGKTTTTYILENILENSSRIGTTNYRVLDTFYTATNTTPESLDLIKLIDESVKKNVEYFIMEVSSHALSLGRCDMLEFSSAIFTNLTQDHLDYHKTFEEYFKSKCRLIDLLKDGAKISLNIDDEYIKTINSSKSISFGVENGDIRGEILEYTNELMKIKILFNNKEYYLNTKLMGKHNLYNILGVVSMLTNLGMDISYILEKIEKIDYVVGRFELIKNNLNAKIVVDYAHTPDGLTNVLKTLKDITKGNLICIFGAGGNRDKTKRPLMAKAASKYSDYIILTSDNPREENPLDILADIEKGLIDEMYKDYEIIENRKAAIIKGISLLKENDSLMIAGKGHETYQIIGKEKMHFSDKEEVLNFLKNLTEIGRV